MMTLNKQIVMWMGIFLGGWLFYILMPVLTPFLIAFGLAYLGNPLVNIIQKRFKKISRTVAVTIVFTLIVLVIALLLLIITPLLINQTISLINKIPDYIAWIQSTLLPKLDTLNVDYFKMDQEGLTKALGGSMDIVGSIIKKVIASISASTLAIIGFFVSLLLIPMLTFYVMRDWNILIARIEALIPRSIAPKVLKFIDDSDSMLSSFLRGQFSVMLVLALIYSIGLSIVGLEFGLLIGLIAGLVSFIPYLGASLGISMGIIMAWFQYGDIKHLIFVGIVFGIGQLLESFVLTPKLVGDKLGMHPIAVMFALMAGGKLFGFFGILLALPVCAVLMVLLRDLYKTYKKSAFYLNKNSKNSD